MLEKKIENEINLKLTPNGNVVIFPDEELSLENGVVFGGNHYGFNLIVEKNGELVATPYGTQCRIVGVQIVGEYLTVLEDNKYISWKFNKSTGELVNEAVFSFLKRTEIDFLRKNYGITDEEGLVKINGQEKKVCN